MTKQNLTYPYLRAWCSMMGSEPYYVEQQLKRAKESDAPHDAIYERAGPEGEPGGWATYHDISSPETRRQIDAILRQD